MRSLAALALVLALASTAHAQLPGMSIVTRGSGAWRVILLHGYGSPPDDLVSLADALVARVPSATFVIPGSPLPWHGDMRGRVWFDQHDADANEQILRARRAIDGLVESFAGVPSEHVIIGGFSQGAILSIEMAIAGRHRLGGIAPLSGRALGHPTSSYAHLAHLPIFASHGRADPMVPFARGQQFVTRARAAGADVQFEIFDGVHEIPRAIEDALAVWLRARTGS